MRCSFSGASAAAVLKRFNSRQESVFAQITFAIKLRVIIHFNPFPRFGLRENLSKAPFQF